ncbi:MAG: hypothetical protein K2R98_08480 [Gemmataceae bacterium]|nr:hypothetical protein [Gemmataceae bacterium]
MAGRRYPRLKPGGQFSAEAENYLREDVEAHGRVRGTGGFLRGKILVTQGLAGIEVTHDIYVPFWARITQQGDGVNAPLDAYGWQEQKQDTPDVWGDHLEGRGGTLAASAAGLTLNQAFPVDHSTSVPIGSVVQMWLADSGDYYLFTYGVPSSRRVLSTSPITVDGAFGGVGTWSADRTIGVGGLSGLGNGNYLVGVFADGSRWEYKQLIAGANVSITHGSGTITIAATGGSTSFTNLTVTASLIVPVGNLALTTIGSLWVYSCHVWYVSDSGNTYSLERTQDKDQPNGYPSLDSGGKVPSSELPLASQSVTGAITGGIGGNQDIGAIGSTKTFYSTTHYTSSLYVPKNGPYGLIWEDTLGSNTMVNGILQNAGVVTCYGSGGTPSMFEAGSFRASAGSITVYGDAGVSSLAGSAPYSGSYAAGQTLTFVGGVATAASGAAVSAIVTGVTAGDASITMGGTATAPTVSVATNGITTTKIADKAVTIGKLAGAPLAAMASLYY